jgi:hypothetical protein
MLLRKTSLYSATRDEVPNWSTEDVSTCRLVRSVDIFRRRWGTDEYGAVLERCLAEETELFRWNLGQYLLVPVQTSDAVIRGWTSGRRCEKSGSESFRYATTSLGTSIMAYYEYKEFLKELIVYFVFTINWWDKDGIENTSSNSSIVACVFVAAETCSPRRPAATTAIFRFLEIWETHRHTDGNEIS